ncbi:cytochrome P450 2K1-like [Engraulis encrasicolus]|uniref:cytochrome P450 2K1-like n=1 Tax=Engraulis encrasicolus TaxID=184585 RepID=UPI002FCFE6D0
MDIQEKLLQLPFTFQVLVAVFVLLLIYLNYTGVSKVERGQAPPGPKPLPVLGNMLLLNLKRPDDSLCELSKKYGSVFTIYFGPKKVVVLAGYKTVKQALVNHAEAFGDRELPPIVKNVFKGHGIVFSNGENWRDMRRFALTNLRNFGMGKRMGEESIIEEAQHLIRSFDNFKGTAFDTGWPVNYAVSNVVCVIVYGRRFAYDDPRFQAAIGRCKNNTQLFGSPYVLLNNSYPWLKPLLKDVRDLIGLTDQTNEIQGYITSRKETSDKSDQNTTPFHDNNLLFSVVNLFGAGTDSTATTIRWGLLLMSKYPHIQDKVHEEIDRVIGGRQPVAEDRKSLPYTDAVIHETQRFADIVPLPDTHITNCDVHFQGFFIEKGTPVLPLLSSVLRDESEWANPYTFHPEHFLDDQGRFVKRDAFMPFSAGRRACVGESLARMELFIFFTSLLQRFRFTAPPGVSEDELDLTPVVGLTANPTPHKLCALDRS